MKCKLKSTLGPLYSVHKGEQYCLAKKVVLPNYPIIFRFTFWLFALYFTAWAWCPQCILMLILTASASSAVSTAAQPQGHGLKQQSFCPLIPSCPFDICLNVLASYLDWTVKTDQTKPWQTHIVSDTPIRFIFSSWIFALSFTAWAFCPLKTTEEWLTDPV